MLKFAANLSMMFNEVEFTERFARAANAGFEQVEYLFPYEYSASEIRSRLDNAGLTQALFNASAGDWESGQRGFAAVVGTEDQFRSTIEQALAYAEVLGNERIHVMSGIPPENQAPEASLECYLNNLQWATEQAQSVGVRLMIEPINNRDMPGYFMNHPDLAIKVLEQLNSPNIALQFDFYHTQIICGDIETRLKAYWSYIDHIQIASVPSRNEPDRGELNYGYLFKLLESKGYKGFVGCEYRPAGDTEAGLGWFKNLRVNSHG